MFDVSRLIGRKVKRTDGPAEIVGAVLVDKYWEVGDHAPRGQFLKLIIVTADGILFAEDVNGLQLLDIR